MPWRISQVRNSLTGGSVGGWERDATQVPEPEHFGGQGNQVTGEIATFDLGGNRKNPNL